MEKPILATNMDGLLLKHDVFIEPHRIWFDRAMLLTKDKGLSKWKGKKNYFIGVDEAMEKIMPNATKEDQTKQAREWYQEDVIYYLKEHPEMIYKKAIEQLKKLKAKFRLALVTSNTKEYINEILKVIGIDDLYDIVFATDISEKPDKPKLFEQFVKEHGKPKIYLAGKNGEAWEECIALGIITIYAAWDRFNPELEKTANRTIQKPEMILTLN